MIRFLQFKLSDAGQGIKAKSRLRVCPGDARLKRQCSRDEGVQCDVDVMDALFR